MGDVRGKDTLAGWHGDMGTAGAWVLKCPPPPCLSFPSICCVQPPA